MGWIGPELLGASGDILGQGQRMGSEAESIVKQGGERVKRLGKLA